MSDVGYATGWGYIVLRVVELFSGIGAPRMALMMANIPHQVIAVSEINPHAIDSYRAIYGDCPNIGDISKVEWLPPCDLLTYGFPCQDISLAGKLAGMGKGTRSGLVWEVLRLLRTAKDRPEWLLMENVPRVLTQPEFKTILKELDDMGYHNKYAKLDSSNFGSAQKRVRAFMISRLNQDPPDLPTGNDEPHKVLRDIMQPEVSEEYRMKIPLERIRWREPKPEYNHPQSKGLECPLIDYTVPRLEERRITAEGSLSPTICANGSIKIVSEEEEEERAKKLCLKADSLRMAKGEKISTLKKTSSEPVADDTGYTYNV